MISVFSRPFDSSGLTVRLCKEKQGGVKDGKLVNVKFVLAVGQNILTTLACWKFDSKCLAEVPLKRLIFLGMHVLGD